MARSHPLSKRTRFNMLFHKTIVRYLFGIAAVTMTFAVGISLTPLIGTGAPFVLFFTAVLVTSLFAGVGLEFVLCCLACRSGPTRSLYGFSSSVSVAATRH